MFIKARPLKYTLLDKLSFLYVIHLNRLAETPECWSLKFQLDAKFADNLGHICCLHGIFAVMVYLQVILSY